MSDAAVSQGSVPFESASELREAHTRLLEALDRQLGQDGSEAEELGALKSIAAQIRQFLERGVATGVYCEEIKARTDCQVLMDYWVSSLSQAGLQVSGVRLARFDGGKLPDLKDKPCPYVGLEAFRDQEFFFGREADTQTALEQVRISPLVLVFGASGSGKLSLVMGGVLPALAVQETPPALWIIPPFVAGIAVLDLLIALVSSAVQFYDGLAPQTRDEVQRFLLELVRVDELLKAYRQPVRRSSLFPVGKANTEEVLNLLEVNDFVRITSAASDAEATVEVKHESLVRN
jgi:hypothetical protein